MPLSPGPGRLGALVPLAFGREHVNVALTVVWDLLGVLVALRLHGLRTLHDRRLLLVVRARDFARRRAVAKRARGGRRAERLAQRWSWRSM